MLVERPSIVGVQQMAIADSLSDDASHKLEDRKVICVDVAAVVRLEGDPISGSVEQAIVGIEYLPR